MKQNSRILYNQSHLLTLNPALLDPIFSYNFNDWFIVGFCMFILIFKNIALKYHLSELLRFFTPSCYVLWLRKVPHLPPNPAQELPP